MNLWIKILITYTVRMFFFSFFLVELLFTARNFFRGITTILFDKKLEKSLYCAFALYIPKISQSFREILGYMTFYISSNLEIRPK